MSSQPSAYGRRFLRGIDLGESLRLQILYYMQTGRRRVETLHSFLFTDRYLDWAQENFDCQPKQEDFEAALRELYRLQLICPWRQLGEGKVEHEPEVVLQRVQVFEITRTGNDFLQKHLTQ